MPHIIPVFPEDPAIRALIVEHKTTLREIVADVLGYEFDEVAVKPDMIRKEDMDMADNLLPLEFVVDAGLRPITSLKDVVAAIRQRIVRQISAFGQVNFGVWPKASPSEFAEHRPGVPEFCGMCEGTREITTGAFDVDSGKEYWTECPCCGEAATAE